MQAFLNAHFGKLLLLVACLWSLVAWLVCPQRPPAFDDETLAQLSTWDQSTFRGKGTPALEQEVQAVYRPEVTSATGVLYPELDSEAYLGPVRPVMVDPKVTQATYQPIEIDVPVPGVPRPSQLLPSPGPSLQGSDKFPRWGEELPPVKAPPPSAPKKP